MLIATVIVFTSFYAYKGTDESSVLGAFAFVLSQMLVAALIPAIIGVLIIKREKKAHNTIVLKILFWIIWALIPFAMVLSHIKDKLDGTL